MGVWRPIIPWLQEPTPGLEKCLWLLLNVKERSDASFLYPSIASASHMSLGPSAASCLLVRPDTKEMDLWEVTFLWQTYSFMRTGTLFCSPLHTPCFQHSNCLLNICKGKINEYLWKNKWNTGASLGNQGEIYLMTKNSMTKAFLDTFYFRNLKKKPLFF